MSQTFACPECKKQYRWKPEMAGKKVKCGGCGSAFVVAATHDAKSADPPKPAKSDPPKPARSGIADLLDEELGSLPTGVGAADLLTADVLATAAVPGKLPPLPPLKSRPAFRWDFQEFVARLPKRKTAAVAASVGFVCWLIAAVKGYFGHGFLCALPGFGLFALAMFLPPRKVRHNAGPWLSPGARSWAGLGACGLLFGGAIYRWLKAVLAVGEQVPVGLLLFGGLVPLGGLAVLIFAPLLSCTVRLGRQFGALRTAAGIYATLVVLQLPLLGPVYNLLRNRWPGEPPAVPTIAEVPLPSFPDRRHAQEIAPGVQRAEVNLLVPEGSAGRADKVWVYLPSGQHAPRSLGCLLIAPAGAAPFCGKYLDGGSDGDCEGDAVEHLPYVRAGFAVVAYEIDGPLFRAEKSSNAECRSAYKQFAASKAGLVNARNALEYVLAKVPEVNPKRIYAAGHSSAGTLALLFAEHEPRLAGCIAYAPAADLESHCEPTMGQLESVLPGIRQFLHDHSPTTHAAKLKCPLFLFHAAGDDVVPIAETERFRDLVKGTNGRVAFRRASGGDHYTSMIREGIPAGIEWLNALPGEKAAAGR